MYRRVCKWSAIGLALLASKAIAQPDVVFAAGGFEQYALTSVNGKNDGTWYSTANGYTKGNWDVDDPSSADAVIIDVGGSHTQVMSLEPGAKVALILNWEGRTFTPQPTREQPQIVTIEFDVYMDGLNSAEVRAYSQSSSGEQWYTSGIGFEPDGSIEKVTAIMPKWAPDDDYVAGTSTYPTTFNDKEWQHVKITEYHMVPPQSEWAGGQTRYYAMVEVEVRGVVFHEVNAGTATTVDRDVVFYSKEHVWTGHLQRIEFEAPTIVAGGKMLIDNVHIEWGEWELPSNVADAGAWEPDLNASDWGTMLNEADLGTLFNNGLGKGLIDVRRVFSYNGIGKTLYNPGPPGDPPYHPVAAYPGLHTRPDWETSWKALSELAEKLIVAERTHGFYLGDEPVWNGIPFSDIELVAKEIKKIEYFPGSTIYWLESRRIFSHKSDFVFDQMDPTWLYGCGYENCQNAFNSSCWYCNPLSQGQRPNILSIPEEIDVVSSYWVGGWGQGSGQQSLDYLVNFQLLQEHYELELSPKMAFSNQKFFINPQAHAHPVEGGSPPTPDIKFSYEESRVYQMGRLMLWATRGTGSGNPPIVSFSTWPWKDHNLFDNSYVDGNGFPLYPAGFIRYDELLGSPPALKLKGYYGAESVLPLRYQIEAFGRAARANGAATGPFPGLADLTQSFEVFSDGDQLPSTYEWLPEVTWEYPAYPPAAPATNLVKFADVDGDMVIRMDRASLATGFASQFRYSWGTMPRLEWNSWDGNPKQVVQFDVFVPGCYADMDTSTGVGVLDIFDFLEFNNLFIAGDPLACDADTSTGVGMCDSFDFLAFQNAFTQGCPDEEVLSFDVTPFRGRIKPGRIVFQRGNSWSTDLSFSFQPDQWNWTTVTMKDPANHSINSTGKLHEGWNTIKIEVNVGSEGYVANDRTNNEITVYLDGVAKGWYDLNDPTGFNPYLDYQVKTDRECVFSTVGFQLWDTGLNRTLLLDNIGMWAEP